MTTKPRQCPFCSAELPPDVRFCENCGKPIPPPRTCPHCRAELSPDVRFCENCGQVVAQSAEAAPPWPAECAPPAAAPAPPIPQYAPPPPSVAPAAPSHPRRRSCLLALAAVPLAACLCLALAYAATRLGGDLIPGQVRLLSSGQKPGGTATPTVATAGSAQKPGGGGAPTVAAAGGGQKPGGGGTPGTAKASRYRLYLPWVGNH